MLSDAIALARSFGLESELFFDAISGSASDSAYARGKGARILAGNRTPQFALNALLKDLRLAQATAGSPGANLLLDALERLFTAASDHGHGNEDVVWVYDAIDAQTSGKG